ncbi:MAG TPA: hypothetical protein VLX67_09845, partial [Stellaceae bacterium]|nr:hypothetical protein [Stellaceae bacterium]
MTIDLTNECDPFAVGGHRGDETASGEPTITELATRLEDVLIAHDRADTRAIAAYQANHDIEHLRWDQEQSRLITECRSLARTILGTPARTILEAATQLTVALGPLDEVATGAGGKRKKARRVFEALESALNVLVEMPDVAVPGVIQRHYGFRLEEGVGVTDSERSQ